MYVCVCEWCSTVYTTLLYIMLCVALKIHDPRPTWCMKRRQCFIDMSMHVRPVTLPSPHTQTHNRQGRAVPVHTHDTHTHTHIHTCTHKTFLRRAGLTCRQSAFRPDRTKTTNVRPSVRKKKFKHATFSAHLSLAAIFSSLSRPTATTTTCEHL